MQTLHTILQCVLSAVPFLLLLFVTRKINLSRNNRGRQFMIPFAAIIYCILAVIFLGKINLLIVKGIRWLALMVPELTDLVTGTGGSIIYISNAALVLGFLIVKLFLLPIANRIWGRSDSLMQKTSGIFYEYDTELGMWLMKKEWTQLKTYFTGFYYAAFAVSNIVFVLSQIYPDKGCFKSAFYPVFGLIILGEILSYLSGMTKTAFVEDILGEDEESLRVANYGMLRSILHDLFGSRVLYENTSNSWGSVISNMDVLMELEKSESAAERALGVYFSDLKAQGQKLDVNYMRSSVNLLRGDSTLFLSPFYRDLTDYIIFPMIRKLMTYQKCLFVAGRDAAAEDVKQWLEDGIYETISTSSLWKVDVLSMNNAETDIGILKFSDLYNSDVYENNEDFFRRTGFVFIVEPSRILPTGQMGLSLLVNRCESGEKKEIVYSACDRNCDGLVDALSHILKTSITEVTATLSGASIVSHMYWNADGEYMHHRILPNISRYLGMGTELNTVALKYQIGETLWLSSDKFPVTDMKWIAGQYYKEICQYTNLPVSQEAFSKSFHVESNLWGLGVKDNSFMVVEDEFRNLFEMTRLFSSRAVSQGFINVISENYFLRDYMLDNVSVFLADPKAIPTIVPDFARTERNTVLKLIMAMAEKQVSEDTVAEEFMLGGIPYEDPYRKLTELIKKHCFVDNVSIEVFFREELEDDALHTKIRKYFTISDNSEIASYADNLRNAYYIAEDEKGRTYYIGAKLYGHVMQALLPGQFLTFDGKYYQIQTITPKNGVVVRRAADHITKRRYYRQLRHMTISDWQEDLNMGGRRSVSDIEIIRGFCRVAVQTEGYLEMDSASDLKNARKVSVSNIPERVYRSKLALRVRLPETTLRVRYTICMLLNEIFRTTYPESWPYICAAVPQPKAGGLSGEEDTDFPAELEGLMYSLQCEEDDDSSIYIIEDSEIDLGLIVSVDRNLRRYFEIITDVLLWHQKKMLEVPEEDEPAGISSAPAGGGDPEEEDTEEQEQGGKKKKKGIFTRIKEFFRRKKKKPAPEEQPEEPETEEKPAGDGVPEETGKPAEIDTPGVGGSESSEEQEDEDSEKNADKTPVLRSRSATVRAREITPEGLDIEGEDEELVDPVSGLNETPYQKNCFLKFGYDYIHSFLAIDETVKYMSGHGYKDNPLTQVRTGADIAEEYEKTYNPRKYGAHFCDFCGAELAGGEYDLLKDGRERCRHCSSTALRTGEEFKEVFKTVMRNMEIFFGIHINAAIKVRMTDAQKIAKHFGEKFVPTPGFDGRTLGFAQKDSTGYSIYVENGSPRLAAMATIAHELTHIWQYQNWDDSDIVRYYGKSQRSEIYEGMAKWAEIQYLIFLNEIPYAKRQEIHTRLRDDPYGRGFIRYAEKYPLSYGPVKKHTPFEENPPL